jgi:hypothetical protein
MNFKKTVAIATAAGALAAISVPAMALENEFHGMYRVYGYMTNALSGSTAFNLKENSATDKYFEQRARIQYTAKANDDLKLVTHFELDSKFGGASNTKYPLGDAGGLDADRITLETKNVYLDFNCPITGSNVKVGIQPFNDAHQGTFGNFDATGVSISKKFDKLTASYSYFTIGSDAGTQFLVPSTTAAAAATLAITPAKTGTTFPSNRATTDLNVADVKFAVNKDLTVGANYYNILSGSDNLFLNMVGLNAAAKVGPAALTASAGYQFGDANGTTAKPNKLNAFGGAVAAKVDVGVGKVNASVLYLSGDKTDTTKSEAWQSASAAVNYFTPANMWLITRNAATINSSTAIGGSGDLTRGGRGILGAFAGFEGAMDKIYYNANVGYAKVDMKRTAKSAAVGTEINATVGYKLYSNLSASFTAAYAILGDGYGKSTGVLLPNGVAKADDPFLTNVALNYSF